ncbi:uncharacterized protein [Apostichopus japonicus]|uniref:uncharacterized protein n=1 Tax=Stichopus japonicus TaxID=307972 RepID=UPI003AB69954
MLRKLSNQQKLNWKEHLPRCMHAYNCSKNDATGFSPFFLMFGRSPRLPVDILFNLESENEDIDHRTFADKWRCQMQEAYSIANRHTDKASAAAKERYDRKTHYTQLSPGRVLVKNLVRQAGPDKLRSYWEDTVYRVVKQINPDITVFEVITDNTGSRNVFCIATCY